MDCTNKNCPAYAKCLAPYRGSRCKATRATYGLGDPLTNADRIRAMTDEELAEWLDGSFRHADWCDQSKFPNGDCMEVPCLGCIINWLKQEVSDG